MRRTGIIATLLGGLLLILGACASPSATAKRVSAPTTLTPTSPTPIPIPAPELTPTPTTLVPATYALAPAPGQADFLAGDIGYVVEVTSAPEQVGFLVSQLQVDPEDVAVGDNVTISVVVTNTGGQRGTYKVVLKFDDAIIKTQDVTIDGGASRKVELNVLVEKYGEFKVMANQLTAKMTVFF